MKNMWMLPLSFPQKRESSLKVNFSGSPPPSGMTSEVTFPNANQITLLANQDPTSNPYLRFTSFT